MTNSCDQCGKSLGVNRFTDNGLIFCSVICFKLYNGMQALLTAVIPANNDRRYLEAVRTHNTQPIKRKYSTLQRSKYADAQRIRLKRLTTAKMLGSHTNSEWLTLCRKYKWRCVSCKQRTPLTRDHIVPIVKGGSDHISNIQPLCHTCNSRKGMRVIDYRPTRKQVA